MRDSISHPTNRLRRHSVAQPDRASMPCSPKIKCTREITSLTGSSSHEELNRPGTFWCKKCNPYRGMTPLAKAELRCQVSKHEKEESDTINLKQNKRTKVEDKHVALTEQPLNSPFKFNSYPSSKHDPVTAQETVPNASRTFHKVVTNLDKGHSPVELSNRVNAETQGKPTATSKTPI